MQERVPHWWRKVLQRDAARRRARSKDLLQNLAFPTSARPTRVIVLLLRQLPAFRHDEVSWHG